MRIVHLSDIHFRYNKNKEIDIDTQIVLKALFDSLEQVNTEKKIDLICITGDLIDKGGQSFDNIGQAFEEFENYVIDGISNRIKLDKNRFVFTPGNHDIDRNLDSNMDEVGIYNILNSELDVNKKIEDSCDIQGIRRIIPYKEFEKKYVQENFNDNEKIDITNYHSTYIINIDNVKIGISCLNTAWRCYDSNRDKERLLLGERQIDYSAQYLVNEKCKVKIALVHHDTSWLRTFEQEAVSNSIKNTYDLIFMGHVHSSEAWKTDRYNSHFISVSPSQSGGNRKETDYKFIDGYHILDYDFERKNIKIFIKGYNEKNKIFVANDMGNTLNGEEFYLQNINEYSSTSIEKSTEIIMNNRDEEKEVNNINQQQLNFEVKSLQINNYSKESIFLKNKIKYIQYLETVFDENVNLDLLIYLLDKFIYKVDKQGNLKKIIENIFYEFDKVMTTENANKIYDVVQLWIEKMDDFLHIDDFISQKEFDCILDIIINKAKKMKMVEISLEQMKNDYLINIINRIKPQFIILIFFSIYVYMDDVAKLVSNIHIGEFFSIKTKDLIENIRLIYNKLNKYEFYDQDILNDTIELIDSLPNECIVVSGENGVGKSILVSDICKKIIERRPYYQIILYSLSISNNIYDIMSVLIEECNIRLVNKINLDILNKINDEINSFDNYKNIIIELFNRLLRENKKVVVIIDSLDNNSDNNSLLFNLIDEIRKYVLVLLMVDSDENDTLKFDQAHYIKLSPISINNINRISNIEDKKLNEKILEISKGNIESILKESEIAKKFNEKEREEYLKKEDEVKITEFENQAEEWIEKHNQGLEDILLMLSIFNSINAIDIEDLQSFLEYKNFKYRLPYIRKMLKIVENQIDIQGYSKLKINQRKFCIYVIRKYFSERDIIYFLKDIICWFTELNDINVDLFTDFFIFVNTTKVYKNINLNEFIDFFIEKCISNSREKEMFEIGKKIIYIDNEFEKLGIRLLECSGKLNYTKAKSFLGRYYFDVKNINYDEAEQLLAEASEKGDRLAKVYLANLLLDGLKVKRDHKRGIRLLEEGVELNDSLSKIYLAERLLTGNGVERDEIRGTKIYNSLVKEENEIAILRFAERLLDGAAIKKNSTYGKELLLKSIELGNINGKIEYANRLLIGDGIEQNIDEGIRILIELSKDNNTKAKFNLSKSYIYGKGIKKNISKGIELLEELVEVEYQDAMILYSRLLIDGSYVEQDQTKALKLLKECIEKENVEAMRILGFMLIDGECIEQDIIKGLKIINNSIEKGSLHAKTQLAGRYYDGKGLNINKNKAKIMYQELIEIGYLMAIEQFGIRLMEDNKNDIERQTGINLVKRAVNLGSENAKLFLAEELIEGTIITRDVIRGMEYLLQLSNNGYLPGKRVLGARLIEGIGIKQNIKEGEKILIKEIKNGDIKSKIILGKAIINGVSNAYSKKEVIKWMTEIGEKDINALRILGVEKLRGLIVEQNKIEGEKLLRKAINKGDYIAAGFLGNILIDGRYVKKNIEEGISLLKYAMKNNNLLASFIYAKCLLQGQVVAKNIEEAEKILLKLIDKSYSKAVVLYCEELIDGGNLYKNIEKAKEIIEKFVKRGDVNVKRLLAEKILDNSIDGYSIEYGISLLEENINDDDELSMTILAQELLSGNKVTRNIERAEILLQHSCIKGSQYGKIVYAMELKKGIRIKKNIEKAKQLFEDLIELGNIKASVEYSSDLIYGKYFERDEEYGERILKKVADDGFQEGKNIYAIMLIKGDGIKKNIQYGIQLLEELIQENYEDSLIEYINLLFDGLYLEKNVERALQLINILKQRGNKRVLHMMANRLIDGNGIKKHISKGTKYYKKCTNNFIANFEYGIRIKNGIGLPKNEKKGKEIIEYSLQKENINMIYNMGMIAYKHKDFQLASNLFFKSYEYKVDDAYISIAYMLRRDEYIGPQIDKTVLELLDIGLENNEYIARVNYALLIIKNSCNDQAWREADSIIGKLQYYSEGIEWWYDVAKRDDVEGDLVIGWLGRHNLIKNRDSISFIDRLEKAQKGGYNIPKWMFIKEGKVEREIAYTN